MEQAHRAGLRSTRADLANNAWQLSAGWVISGEDAGYKGVLKPSHAFAIDGEGWGAFELVGRIGRLDIDDDAFPLFADPSVASTARTPRSTNCRAATATGSGSP